MSPEVSIIILVIVALIFDYLNGFHDASNIVATMISSGAASPRAALAMVAGAQFVGPLVFGVAVATTVGKEVVNPESITIGVVLAALGSAIAWNIVTWFLGLPSSSSHALIGGLVGSAVASAGFSHLQVAGLIKVGIGLFGSPILAMIVGYLLFKLVLFSVRGAPPRINWVFKRSQVPTAILLSLSHGSNDAQKTMGVITMSLVILGFQHEFAVPLWVIIISATAISLGTATGGWRIIRTIGGGFYRIRPIHAFSSQSSSGAIVLAASLLGGPVSTTHVVSSSIMGVGSAERLSKVRWGVGANIFVAWVITIPATALGGMLLYALIG